VKPGCGNYIRVGRVLLFLGRLQQRQPQIGLLGHASRTARHGCGGVDLRDTSGQHRSTRECPVDGASGAP